MTNIKMTIINSLKTLKFKGKYELLEIRNSI